MPVDTLYTSSEAYDIVLSAKDYVKKLALVTESNMLFQNSNRAKHDLDMIHILIDIVETVSQGLAPDYNFIRETDAGYNKVVAFLKHKIESGYVVLSAPLTIVTQPVGISLSIGGTINLTTTASGGTGGYRYQWYYTNAALDIYNKVIVGATSSSYSKAGAAAVDGGLYFCKVTDANGASVVTNSVTVTVAQTIVVEHGFSLTDPYSSVLAGSFNVYQVSFNMSNGGQVSIPVPSGFADNYYHVTKVPLSQSPKTIWYNTGLNQGTIPDSVYRSPYTSGGYLYYVTRVPISVDTLNTLKLY